MKIDSDPLKVAEAHYIEPQEVNLIEVAEDFNMTEVTEDFINGPVMAMVSEYFKQKPLDDFAQKAVGDITNKNDDASDAEDAESSKLMMITKETADGFVQMDKATEGLQIQFQRLDITEDIHMEVNMVEVSQETSMEVDDECRQEEYNKIAFPKEEETLSNFLRRCQKKKSEVMLCPWCSVVFDKKEAQNLEGVRRVNHQDDHKAVQNHQDVKARRAFDPRRYPDLRWIMVRLDKTKQAGPDMKPISFKPSVEGSNGNWVKPTDGRKRDHGKWKNFEVERGSSLAYHKEFWADKRTSHVCENYKGKNPMTRSQWRRE